MRGITRTLALALFVVGCALPGSGTGPATAPPGEAIGVVGYGVRSDMSCQDRLVTGLLRADVEVQDRLIGRPNGNPITLEIGPGESVGWPPDVAPEQFIPIRWPLEFTGIRLADGEVAVLDGDGHLVAITGNRYRLAGEWAIVAAIGGPLFGKPPWIDAFNVCRGSGSVTPH